MGLFNAGKETEPKSAPEAVAAATPEMKVPEQLKKETGIAPVEKPTLPARSPIKEIGEEEVKVEIPTNMDKLERLAKGKSDDSSTWFGKFWMRMIKVFKKAGKKFFFKS